MAAGKRRRPGSELIIEIARRARAGAPRGRAKLADTFARLFFAHAPIDELRSQSVENLAGAALSLFALAGQRQKDAISVRVHNPRAATHGWTSPHTVVEIVNDDMPFLVSTVTAEFGRRQAEVLMVIHPVMGVERDARGKLVALFGAAESAKAARPESIMHVLVAEQPPSVHAEIERSLAHALGDARAAVEDWPVMRDRCHTLVAELENRPPQRAVKEIAQSIAFLRWIDDDHFTYLGYREYAFEGQGRSARSQIRRGSGLGVLRDATVSVFDGLRSIGKLSPEIRDFVKRPILLRISKANRRATVHRSTLMDTISVKAFDDAGNVTGERLFVGLFTSMAYSSSPREIPLLREKVAHTVERAGFHPASHDGQALLHILESYPRDELFQISEDELLETAMGILRLQDRQRVALFLRRDPFERFVSAMVFVPRDRYDTTLRLKLQEILTARLNGTIDAFATHLSDSPLARLYVVLRIKPGGIPELDTKALEADLAEASRSWTQRLEGALVAERGQEGGLRVARRFGKAFPLGYQERLGEAVAVQDIARIEEALETGGLAMNLYRPPGAGPHSLHFKLYVTGQPVPLSDVLPMLENMGAKVIGEAPHEVRPEGADTVVWIHDFDMVTRGRGSIDPDKVRLAFHDAFARVWRGRMENDGFNKLVLNAGLTAREVIILRAYSRFLRQAGIPFSHEYMQETLFAHPGIARRLVDLFLALFDPEAGEAGAAKAKRLEAAVAAQLDEVTSLDDDRIIRRFLNAILSTLRTNYFQPAADGGEKPYVSLKLDSRALEELPLPRPFREIFVYSPRFEGVHLRFGMVARGGLRWSDRREDFRTEVLSLVKAQQVKNAVIVPVGSKGGFVVKIPPPPEAGRKALLDEGIACYRTFVYGLLDVTDNRKGDEIVPPPRVVRRDGDDPYLVVAADKGTATFSDIANEVSREHGFWLDDAFASGGSAGYDHKKMAITARGVWESVKRHFREIGKDIQSQDFTCIGVGDMGGDVFGNGMLLSRHTLLVGAFNHLHVFLDPKPDAAASWAERKRLFDAPGSSWSDYDPKLVSKGGGVFDRKAKSIKVTPEMKALLGIAHDHVPPNELIRALLKAPVELLYFGGIGTFVKSSDESHADVGDRTNDGVRVDARDVKAKVVGEGANLGMTQRGRVEYELSGGRLNTDSIDNSAGVDCSDHEVNIKILLGDLERSGQLDRKQRDRLLTRMSDEVAELVLRDNYLQTQAITVTHRVGARMLDRLARMMRGYERAGQLDRAIEFLPDDETVLERQKQGAGMTRPELAVLLSYSKIVLCAELAKSELPDDPAMADRLLGYFPSALRKPYADAIARHRLRRELTATVVTNEIVNRVGPAFVFEVHEKTGMPPEEIARAYVIGADIFGMPEIWRGIEALDNKAPARLQAEMLIECGRLVERTAVWLLVEGGRPLDIRKKIEEYGQGARYLMENLDSILTDVHRALVDERSAAVEKDGVAHALARRVASLPLLVPACDIVRIAGRASVPVGQVGRAYFAIGARFGFDWLRKAAGTLPIDSAWHKLAVTAIIDDLFGHQSDLTSRVLDGAKDGEAAGAVIDRWAASRRPVVARTEQLLSELQAIGTPDFAMLAIANRQLKSMVAG